MYYLRHLAVAALLITAVACSEPRVSPGSTQDVPGRLPFDAEMVFRSMQRAIAGNDSQDILRYLPDAPSLKDYLEESRIRRDGAGPVPVELHYCSFNRKTGHYDYNDKTIMDSISEMRSNMLIDIDMIREDIVALGMDPGMIRISRDPDKREDAQWMPAIITEENKIIRVKFRKCYNWFLTTPILTERAADDRETWRRSSALVRKSNENQYIEGWSELDISNLILASKKFRPSKCQMLLLISPNTVRSIEEFRSDTWTIDITRKQEQIGDFRLRFGRVRLDDITYEGK